MIYPLKHISIRVPWHDSGWNGTICANPKQNTACLKLINIAESKNDTNEEEFAGQSLKDISHHRFPPCIKERGTFMANFQIERLHEHPYTKYSSETHAHFRPTPLNYPAYGAAGLPFRWMMKPVVFGDKKKGERGLINDYPLSKVDEALEPKLKFDTFWVQDHRNHRALLECFWNHIQVEESLVFFYAKQVPLVEDAGRRVLLGVGRVLKLLPPTEYLYDGSPEGKIRSLLWEQMVVHSIRPDFRNGFLLPYHEALDKSNEGRTFDPAEVVAFAPEDRFLEFSYATEHVGNDAAISALLACRSALLRSGELFNYTTADQELWIDRQLGRLWKKRGAFPGLGAVLNAKGVPMGNFIAQALTDKAGEGENPWHHWDETLKTPNKHLPKELACHIDPVFTKEWQKMEPRRRLFLELLSRIDLSDEQAAFLAIPEERKAQGLDISDEDFLCNPYLIYEATRLSQIPVGIGTVDRGLFPSTFIRNDFPLPDPSTVKTALDGRRLRALVIRELEDAASRGDTLRPQAQIITALRDKEQEKDEKRTDVNADILAVVEDENFPEEVRLTTMADESKAYQLERLAQVGKLIQDKIRTRSNAKRHELTIDWRTKIDDVLQSELPSDPYEREKEELARQEKSAALAEIASARFSVLIGPAGTGKTTLLSALCKIPDIKQGGITMLAPTGKARVRMEDVARRAGAENLHAQTLAQFLSRTSPPRYDGRTQRYYLTGQPGEKGARTVIVDECSMLTEEMVAALLEALSGVHRLIFVGDHRQLPPIGAGRPFMDIVANLRPEDYEARFPRIGKSYAELTVPRRQAAGDRDDLQLAAWFGGNALSPGEDQVFEILSGKRTSSTIQFVQWETPDELEVLLPKKLSKSLSFSPEQEEWQAFACSLGGALYREHVYFNCNRSGERAEAWQILSPVRQKPWGVEALNRRIHERYKARQLETARANVYPSQRRIPKPFGDAQIVYGDKVINVRNQSIQAWKIYPKTTTTGYLANGEIGMAVGQIRTQNFNYEPKYLEVEFSTQKGSSFRFEQPRGDDNDFSLELAYALTVHKAQGSEFGTVFLVLPRSSFILNREMLYTALTRQKDKIVIFHQGSPTDLLKLSSERYSATAARLTNLFKPPKLVLIGESFLEEFLIHRTERGEAVRSKSEVIIANMLYANKLDYHHEQPLDLGGYIKYPDFTIDNDDTGITYYWEHCGMLHDISYRRRWETKLAWYKKNGILPIEEGGGGNGALIVTRDDDKGGFDSEACAKYIATIIS